MSKAQQMDQTVQAGGKAGMSLCARLSAGFTVAALAVLGVLFAVTGDWSYLKLAGVLAFLTALTAVFNLVLPARSGACGTDKTECGDAR
jgi:hypothetical protein